MTAAKGQYSAPRLDLPEHVDIGKQLSQGNKGPAVTEHNGAVQPNEAPFFWVPNPTGIQGERMVKHIPMDHLLKVPFLTAARRAVALIRMRHYCQGVPGLQSLVAPLEASLEAQRGFIRLKNAEASAGRDAAMHARNAKVVDAQLDRALTALSRTLDNLIHGLTAESEEAQLATSIQGRLFPQGVSAITSLPYVDQHMAVANLLALVNEDDGALMTELELLGQRVFVDRIGELNQAYGELVTRPQRMTPSVLAQLDRDAARQFGYAVAQCLAATASDSDEHTEWRTQLLQPIVDQQQELAKLRERRREGGLPAGMDDDELDDESEIEEAALSNADLPPEAGEDDDVDAALEG